MTYLHEFSTRVRAIVLFAFLTGSSGCTSHGESKALSPLEQACMAQLRTESIGNRKVMDLLDAKDFNVQFTKETHDVFSAVLEGNGSKATVGFLFELSTTNCGPMDIPIFTR
jgi:hypothetical protein